MTTHKNNNVLPRPMPVFSRIVQEVASKSINIDRHETKAGIVTGLHILASALHAQRASFIILDRDGSTVLQYFEWSRTGLNQDSRFRSGINLALDYPWLYQIIDNQENYITEFPSLPTAATKDLDFLNISGSGYCMIGIFPIVIENGCSGSFIFGDIQKINSYDDELDELFRSTGNYFGYVLQQQVNTSIVFERELKFSSIYDSISNAILLITNQQIVDCNKAAVELFGYTDKAALSAHHPRALLNLDKLYFANLMTSVNSGERVDTMQQGNATLHRQDDTSIEVELHMSSVEIDNEQMVLVAVWPSCDYRTESPIISFSPNDLRHFLDIITEPAFLLDLHGNVISINSGGTVLFGSGRDVERMANFFTFDIISPDDVPKFNDILYAVISSGETKLVEVVPVSPDLSKFYLSATPIMINGQLHSLFKMIAHSVQDNSVAEQTESVQIKFQHQAPSEVINDTMKHHEPKYKTILLVEDELHLRNLLKDILDDSGYITLVAQDATVALDIVKSNNFTIDLLITDLNLPDVNGIDLAKIVRDIQPDTDLLLMSGLPKDAQPDDIDISDDLPYLEKPFRASDLLLAIDKLQAQRNTSMQK